jgi:hypothetical protein
MYVEVTLAEIIVVANQTWQRACRDVLALDLRDCSAAPVSTVLDCFDRVGDPAEYAGRVWR